MTLESICTSLEMSKKLKEAGFEMETRFYWEEDTEECICEEVGMDMILTPEEKGYIPAYTFEQLIEAIPKRYSVIIERPKNDQPYIAIGYYTYHGYDTLKNFFEGSLSDMMAQAVLWCIENNYISVNKTS